MSDTRRQALNVITAIAQAAAPAMPALGIGISVGARAGVASPLEVPAGYAFSIWGVIFLLGLIYAVQQALPSARSSSLYREIGTGAWTLFGLSTAWMFVAQLNGPNAVLAVIIVIMLVVALRILATAWDNRGDAARTVVMPLFGLYAGWLTLATALNISGVLRDFGLAPFDLPDWQYASVVLLAGTLVAVPMLMRVQGLIWYAAAAVWGLAAVAVKDIPLGLPDGYGGIVAGGIALLLVLMAANYRRARYREPAYPFV
ncbi:MAG: hypothetical protein ACFB0Z_00955 [Candidatus Phaeomarinobacter sp.]